MKQRLMVLQARSLRLLRLAYDQSQPYSKQSKANRLWCSVEKKIAIIKRLYYKNGVEINRKYQ